MLNNPTIIGGAATKLDPVVLPPTSSSPSSISVTIPSQYNLSSIACLVIWNTRVNIDDLSGGDDAISSIYATSPFLSNAWSTATLVRKTASGSTYVYTENPVTFPAGLGYAVSVSGRTITFNAAGQTKMSNGNSKCWIWKAD